MDQIDQFLRDAFGSDSGPASLLGTLGHLGLAAALGWVVAQIHQFGSRGRVGASDLTSTLVLLSMLISMVTLAIGNDTARAFTLVGTLAIVRFRTSVRDIRDTAFVIFAVAVGLSVGAFNPVVAVAGTVGIGAIAALLAVWDRGSEGSARERTDGRLSLRVGGEGAETETLDPILREGCRAHRLLFVRDDRDGNVRMTYEVTCRRQDAMGLVSKLRRLPGVLRVAISFGLMEEEPDSAP